MYDKNRVPCSIGIHGGIHEVYRFPNDYGASVIQNSISYGGNDGKFELAVIKFNSDDNTDWSLCYDTPITSDVLGWLSRSNVNSELKKIKNLPKS